MSLIYQDKEIAGAAINDSQKSKNSTYSSQKIEELTAQAGGGVTYYIKGSSESESGYTNLLDVDDNLVTWNQYLVNRDNCSVMLLDDFYVNIPTFEGLRLTPTNIYSDEFNAVISTENSILEDKSPRLITAILYTPDDWDNDPIEVGIIKEVLGGGGSGDDKLKELISTNLDRGYLGGGIIHPNLYEYDDEYLYRDVKFSYHYGQLELSSEKTSTTQSINTYIYTSIQLQAGVEYRFMGCAEGGSDSTYMLRLTDASIYHDITDYQGTTFVASGGRVNISIIIKSNVDVNGLVFTPQIVEEKYYFEGASFPQSWSNSVLTEAVRQLQNPLKGFVTNDNEYILDSSGNKIPFSYFNKEIDPNISIYMNSFKITINGNVYETDPCMFYYSYSSYWDTTKNYYAHYTCMVDMPYTDGFYSTDDKIKLMLSVGSRGGYATASVWFGIIKSCETLLKIGTPIEDKQNTFELNVVMGDSTERMEYIDTTLDFKVLIDSTSGISGINRPIFLKRDTSFENDIVFNCLYSNTDDDSTNVITGIWDSDYMGLTISVTELQPASKSFYIQDLAFTSGNASKASQNIYKDKQLSIKATWEEFTASKTQQLIMLDSNKRIKTIFNNNYTSYTSDTDFNVIFETVSNAKGIGVSNASFAAGYTRLTTKAKSDGYAVFDATFTELQQVHKTLQLEMRDDGNHIYRYVNGQKTADFKKFSTFMMNSEYDILCIRYPYHFGKLTGGYNNDYNYFVYSGILKNDSDDKLYAVMVTFSDDGNDGIVTNYEAKALV